MAKPKFTPSEKTEAAALGLARGKSAPKIAAEIGVDEKTVDRWKKIPEFAARVEFHQKAIREAITKEGLAVREERVRHLKQRHAMLRRIIRGRQHDENIREYLGKGDNRPGIEAGLMVVKWKGKEALQPEFAVDTGLLAELRAIEEQIAIEVGDWKVKHEVRGTVVAEYSDTALELANTLAPAELAALNARLAAARAARKEAA